MPTDLARQISKEASEAQAQIQAEAAKASRVTQLGGMGTGLKVYEKPQTAEQWAQEQTGKVSAWKTAQMGAIPQGAPAGEPQYVYDTSGLTGEEIQVLKDYGPEEVNRRRQLAAETAWEESTVRVAGGERVDKEEFEALPPEAQERLKSLGVGSYNRWVEEEIKKAEEFEATHIEVSPDKWVEKVEWGKLTPSQQKEVKETGQYTVEGPTIQTEGIVVAGKGEPYYEVETISGKKVEVPASEWEKKNEFEQLTVVLGRTPTLGELKEYMAGPEPEYGGIFGTITKVPESIAKIPVFGQILSIGPSVLKGFRLGVEYIMPGIQSPVEEWSRKGIQSVARAQYEIGTYGRMPYGGTPGTVFSGITEAFFPAVRGFSPKVSFKDIQTGEWVATGISATLLTSPKWVPPIVRGIKRTGTIIKEVTIGGRIGPYQGMDIVDSIISGKRKVGEISLADPMGAAVLNKARAYGLEVKSLRGYQDYYIYKPGSLKQALEIESWGRKLFEGKEVGDVKKMVQAESQMGKLFGYTKADIALYLQRNYGLGNVIKYAPEYSGVPFISRLRIGTWPFSEPAISAAEIAAREAYAKTVVKTIEINWNKLLPKVSEIKWRGIAEPFKRYEVEVAASEAARFAKVWERYKSAGIAKKLPPTPAQEALQASRTAQGMKAAAEAAARVRQTEAASQAAKAKAFYGSTLPDYADLMARRMVELEALRKAAAKAFETRWLRVPAPKLSFGPEIYISDIPFAFPYGPGSEFAAQRARMTEAQWQKEVGVTGVVSAVSVIPITGTVSKVASKLRTWLKPITQTELQTWLGTQLQLATQTELQTQLKPAIGLQTQTLTRMQSLTETITKAQAQVQSMVKTNPFAQVKSLTEIKPMTSLKEATKTSLQEEVRALTQQKAVIQVQPAVQTRVVPIQEVAVRTIVGKTAPIEVPPRGGKFKIPFGWLKFPGGEGERFTKEGFPIIATRKQGFMRKNYYIEGNQPKAENIYEPETSGIPSETFRVFGSGRGAFISEDLGIVDNFMDLEKRMFTSKGYGLGTDVGKRIPGPTKGITISGKSPGFVRVGR